MTSKITIIPKNVDELTKVELQSLIDKFDKRRTKDIKILNQKLQEKNVIVQALQDMMPQPEYFSEIRQTKRQLSEKQIQYINNLTQKQLDDYTKKFDNKFDTPFKNLIFRRNIESILVNNLNNSIRVVYQSNGRFGQNSDQNIQIFLIKSGLIKELKDFLSEEQQLTEEDQLGSDQKLNYILTHTLQVEIITQKQHNKNGLNQADNSTTKQKGAYFNYYNLTSLDLSKYQIGKNQEEHNALSQQHCLIHTLKVSEKYTEQQIQFIISQICDDINLFSLKSLKLINGLGYIVITKYNDNDTVEKIYLNKEEGKEPLLDIGLFKEHFFLNEEIPVSEYWVKNYSENKLNLKFIENTNISQMRGNSVRQKDINTKVGVILKTIAKNNLFEEIKELNQFNFKSQNKELVGAPLEAQTYCIQKSKDLKVEKMNEEQLQEHLKDQNEFEDVYFGDFESFTTDDNNEAILHDQFLLCYRQYNIKTNQLQPIQNGRNIQSLFNHIKRQPAEEILVYFHNLTYDATFILKQKIDIMDIIYLDGKLLQFKLYLDHKKVIFRDSLRIISSKLSEMPEMFLTIEEQANIYKEIFPYNYYTKSRYINDIGNIDEAIQHTSSTREEFVKSIQRANAQIDNDNFSMQKYALFYCEQDIEVLSKSVLKFREMVKVEFKNELFNFISISTLSLTYQKQNKCFDGCYQNKGLLRKFLQQFIIGGRVMIADNTKNYISNQKVVDFDGVSLYPSAQKRIWYPTGEAKTLSQEQIQYYNNPENLFKITEDRESIDQNTLYLQIKLSQDETFIPRHFPLLSSIDKNGVRQFTNEIINEYYFYDVIGLQDLVKFQNYKYQIISGVYYETRNYKIQEVVQYMFEQRLKYKALKNPCQILYKLCLNSSYGKTCESLHNTTVKILDNRKFSNYVQRNFNTIDSIKEIGMKYFITENQEVNNSSSYNHIGSLILSMSKRIMNELITTMEDNNIKCYYQDTDSTHILLNDIPRLENKYFEKYNRKLIGKQLGQFHSDFESKLGKVLYADKSIFLQKKVYLDRLVVEIEDKTLIYDYHIRSKGVSDVSMLKYCEKNNISIVELYEKLFYGEKITFDLCDGGVMMKHTKEFDYINLQDFKREMSIPQ